MSSRNFEHFSLTPTTPPPDQRDPLFDWVPGTADGLAVGRAMVFIFRNLNNYVILISLIGRQNQPIYEEAALGSIQEHSTDTEEASCLHTDGRILENRSSSFKRPRRLTTDCALLLVFGMFPNPCNNCIRSAT